MSRLREGRANTARGAAHFLRETVGRVRYVGAKGQLTVRADSGFYTHAVVAVCRETKVRVSITIRQHVRLWELIEAIPETEWTPIPLYLDFGDGAERGRPASPGSRQTVQWRGSPHSPPAEPEQLPGPNEPVSCKDGPALTQEVQMEENPRYVGIDVSKAQVDVAGRPTGRRWAAFYNETGVGELVSQIVDIGPAMVLLEATGGLEVPLVAALAAAALPVVVNPRQVFATSPGPPVRWPRPTLSMRQCWPTSPTPFVPPCALSETPRRRYSTRWRPAGTKC